MFYARKDRPSPDREIAEISEHLQQLSVRLAKLQGQHSTEAAAAAVTRTRAVSNWKRGRQLVRKAAQDSQRVLEVDDATFLEQYVHLRKGPQFLVLFYIG